MRDIEAGVGQDEGFLKRRTALEMYAFLLAWFVSSVKESKEEDGESIVASVQAKSRRGRGGGRGGRGGASRKGAAKDTGAREAWNWIDHIPHTLTVISRGLRIQTQRVWTTTAERDTFVG